MNYKIAWKSVCFHATLAYHGHSSEISSQIRSQPLTRSHCARQVCWNTLPSYTTCGRFFIYNLAGKYMYVKTTVWTAVNKMRVSRPLSKERTRIDTTLQFSSLVLVGNHPSPWPTDIWWQALAPYLRLPMFARIIRVRHALRHSLVKSGLQIHFCGDTSLLAPSALSVFGLVLSGTQSLVAEV